MECLFKGIPVVIVYLDDILIMGLSIKEHLATVARSLKQSTPWHWKTEQQEAFDKSKKLLTSSQLLVHFNPELEILACDASDYGIGAVLSHLMPDGSEIPIGCVENVDKGRKELCIHN